MVFGRGLELFAAKVCGHFRESGGLAVRFDEVDHVRNRQMGWNVDQFLRRSKRFIQLPTKLERDDLLLVSRSLLPGASDKMAQVVAAHAALKEHQLDAIKDLAREARMLAEEAGRDQIKLADLERAMQEVLEATLLAKVKAMGPAANRTPAGAGPPRCRRSGAAFVWLARGITPGSADADDEFSDEPVLAG